MSLHLEALVYPKGYKCAKCSSTSFSKFQRCNQTVFQCSDCRSQKNLTSGTLFERSKIPLLKWFQAFYFIAQGKNCISSMELMRHLEVNYNTALMMKHKIMEAMYIVDDFMKLEGRIEIDDAYLGGKKKGGKSGRGSENKTPFVVAVESSDIEDFDETRPKRARFSVVQSFSADCLDDWAIKYIRRDESTHIVSDGLGCFNVFGKCCSHEAHTTSKMPHDEKDKMGRYRNYQYKNGSSWNLPFS